MKRNDFIKKGLVGLGGIAAVPAVLSLGELPDPAEGCDPSPRETRGPFPNKTPAQLVRGNITGDRRGIPLLIELEVVQAGAECVGLPSAVIDIWHCDNQGRYSEYGDNWLQREDLTGQHFLRGRQQTDPDGRVAFISIFPGYYRGRAPHIHLEVSNGQGQSLLVSQIAFPHDICDQVYATAGYQGAGYVANERDGVFRNSLQGNRCDALSGNLQDGYTLRKRLVIPPVT